MIYVAKFEEAAYVLHAFEKVTQKTRRTDIDLAKARYRAVDIPIIWYGLMKKPH